MVWSNGNNNSVIQFLFIRSSGSGLRSLPRFVLKLDEPNFQHELSLALEENSRLGDDLKRQGALYNELKKMRGRGEEIDMLQHTEQVGQGNIYLLALV